MGLNSLRFNATIRARFGGGRAAGKEIRELTPPFAASLPTLRVTWREVGLWLGALALAGLGLAWLMGGDSTGVLPLVAAAACALLVHRRLLPIGIWLGAAGWAAYLFLQGATPALAWVGLGVAASGLAAWRGGQLGPRVSLPKIHPAPSAPAPAPAAALAPPPPVSPLPKTKLPANLQPSGTADAAPSSLVVRTLGRLQVLDAEGRDLTGKLLRKRVLCFLWLHLLIRALDTRPGPILKDTLANESAPGLDAQAQRDNFRRQIWDLRRDLPAPVAATIRSDEDHIWLELAECSVDLIEVRTLLREVKTAGELLSLDLQGRVQAALSEVGDEPFLMNWEELERRATRAKRRGEPNPHVLALRAEIDASRSLLAAALGLSLQAQGSLEEAARWLRKAVKWDPGRGDLVPRVVAIYLQLNLGGRADEFRQKYESGEEV